MTGRTALARGLALGWRRVPLRGGGRVLDALLLQRNPAPTTTTWAGGTLQVDFENPPETSVWMWGTYEPDVIAALEWLLTPGATAIDIGANCGVITMKMRELVGSGGKVLAVDPSPRSVERVLAHAQARGQTNVSAVATGLGATESQAVFHTALVGIGALPEADQEFGTEDSVEVSIRRLDQLVHERELTPDLLKIDTDGSELEILRGAEQTLAEHRPAIVFELCRAGLHRRGYDPRELQELLFDAGYELWAPVLRPRPRWLVGPARALGFRPVAGFDAAGDDVPNLVAIDPLKHRPLSVDGARS
jgi:FkbM family methyltransferase